MTTPGFHRWRARWRAERFARLLDEAGGGEAGACRRVARSRSDQGLANLAEVGRRLARIDTGVRADPEFRDGLRAMLMATIEREGIGATGVPPEPDPVPPDSKPSWIPIRGRRTRGTMVIVLVVCALTVSGMSAASGGAIPGDSLYGMKRSTERAHLALAGSQIGRGQLYLEFARTRMNEAAALPGDAPGLARLLDDMDNETRQGVKLLTTAAVDWRDSAALDVIDAFIADQRRAMIGMLGALTGGARGRAADSVALLDDIEQRVDGLRGDLRCSDIASGDSDQPGPTPPQCSAHGPAAPSSGGGASGSAGAGSTASSATATHTEATAASTLSRPGSGTSGSRLAPQPNSSTRPSTPAAGRRSSGSIIDRIGHLLGGTSC